MFSKTIKLSKYIVNVQLSEHSFYEDDNSLIFGYPININEVDLSVSNQILGNKLKGYWLKIDIQDHKIVLTNDILGGYRVYYFIQGNNIYISDNYSTILKDLQNIELKKNEVEFNYWLKHRFTSGKATFIDGLKKLNPASILEISENSFTEVSYFKDIKRSTNSVNHKNKIHEDLLNTFSVIKKAKTKTILLFSGGKDSCLLLQYLLHFNIPFTPVFFKLNPISKLGLEDLKRVRAVAKELGLQLDEVEINLSDLTKEEQDIIVEKQLFDRHFSILHYKGSKIIKEKYGTNCIVINGQSSDSILSFGPSENSMMSYFRRNIMYKPKTIISKIGVLLLMLKTKRKFKLPINKEEALVALFDEYKYTRVIDCQVKKNYINYLKEYIKAQTKHLTSIYAKEMYVKILSFSQGSDNQVVVNSSKLNQILTIMPFSTPNIIYTTIKYKDENLEIKKPKYIIERILEEEFAFHYDALKINEIDVSDVIINENTANIEIDCLFQEKAKSFFKS